MAREPGLEKKLPSPPPRGCSPTYEDRGTLDAARPVSHVVEYPRKSQKRTDSEWSPMKSPAQAE